MKMQFQPKELLLQEFKFWLSAISSFCLFLERGRKKGGEGVERGALNGLLAIVLYHVKLIISLLN